MRERERERNVLRVKEQKKEMARAFIDR